MADYSIVYIFHNFFIYLSVDGHLGCFHVLAIANSAAVNIGIHVSFSILVSLGYMPRNGIAGSWAPKSLQMVTAAMKLKEICS